jgi:hypothetical protein
VSGKKGIFMKKVIFCSFIPMLLTAQVSSQPAPPPPPPPPGPNVFFYQSAIPAMPMDSPGRRAKPVANAPYQAEIETQTVQHLADGNAIQNSHTSKMARDSQGRTWTEETVDRIGPWSSGTGPRTIIFISDPVTGNSYVLHPDSKTIEKMSVKRFDERAERGRRTMIVQRDDVSVGTGGPVGITATITGPDGPARIEKIGPGEPGDEQKEDLGTQQINGVMAQGKRLTRTIPANTIGNQLPIVSVTETWYSPDLQMVVQSKHDDPRFGETTMNVKNIQKGEPSPDLFQVPSDYTVSDGPKIALPLKP